MSSYYIDLESMDDMRVDHYCVDHEVYWKIKIMLDEYTAKRAGAIN